MFGSALFGAAPVIAATPAPSGNITASVILSSARITLLDLAARTWSDDDLLDYLNEFLRTTAGVKPDFYTVQDYVALIGGDLQVIPADGVALIDITENADGRVITQADFKLLQESNRFWPRGTRESTVENFAADPRNPRRFVVSPPNDGTGSVRLLYGAVPPQIMYADEEMPVSDSYQNAAINFVLAKCYAKNSQRQDIAKANSYMGQWAQFLGLKSQAQLAVSPKVASSPGTTS